MEFCVGWAPTVQPVVDPALLVCGDIWVKKWSLGELLRDLVRERGKQKAVSCLFFAGENYQHSSWSTSTNCNYAFVYQRRSMFVLTWCLGRWDIPSWEIGTLGLAACTQLLQGADSPCSVVTVIWQYSAKAMAVFSAFIAFWSGSGWSNGANASRTDFTDLSL